MSGSSTSVGSYRDNAFVEEPLDPYAEIRGASEEERKLWDSVIASVMSRGNHHNAENAAEWADYAIRHRRIRFGVK